MAVAVMVVMVVAVMAVFAIAVSATSVSASTSASASLTVPLSSPFRADVRWTNGSPKELFVQFARDLLQVHEIAIAPSVALVGIELPTACFSEIRDRRKFRQHRLSAVKSPAQPIFCLFCIVFIIIFDVNIPTHVVAEIITDMKFLDFTEFGQLFVNVVIEKFKLILEFRFKFRVSIGCNFFFFSHSSFRIIIKIYKNIRWHKMTQKSDKMINREVKKKDKIMFQVSKQVI